MLRVERPYAGSDHRVSPPSGVAVSFRTPQAAGRFQGGGPAESRTVPGTSAAARRGARHYARCAASIPRRLMRMPPTPRVTKINACTTVRYWTGDAVSPMARNTTPSRMMSA